MGWWNNFKESVSSGWKNFKEGSAEFLDDLKKAGKTIGTKIEKGIEKAVDGLVDFFTPSKTDPDIIEEIKNVGGFVRGNDRITETELAKRADAITNFQKKVKKWATQKEQAAVESYRNIYKTTIADLTNAKIDVKDLSKEISNREKYFYNIIKHYVNIKISLSDNDEFKNLSESKEPDTVYYENLEIYQKKIMADAKKKLLEQFKISIAETNKYVDDYIKNQLQSYENHLKELKERLINFSGSKGDADKALVEIGEIVAITTLIESIAKE
jgi:hypothetical protein